MFWIFLIRTLPVHICSLRLAAANFWRPREKEETLTMDPKTDKLVRRTTMVATAVASYLLLTADYGPQPTALDPIKNAILSAQRSVKEFVFGSNKVGHKNETEKAPNGSEKA